ncbi:MAG: UDP-N-acetylglucosamine 1-carboxyvinyltransferase [Lachnospiraceae bacterium]|jgi:UDP-N-acetylglucosamine 1-carboxyvinyltransferase|nr:UDP-N-acetylglucosamine 1-carboxyvinyltransferase [Lachnospiraceae bacterium]
MDSIHIHGGVKLQGKVRIQGSKNAVLPILAATILTKGNNFIENCPKLSDVDDMLSLITKVGCVVSRKGRGVQIDSTIITDEVIVQEEATKMRSSLCLIGVLIARNGRIRISHPGGCCIGDRPIDLHLMALRQMGVTFREDKNIIEGNVEKKLHGANIIMPMISVGATENVVMAATMAEGTTILDNAALEPEVEILCHYLVACGAQIEGIGTKRLVIHGQSELGGVHYRIPGDRIVAGTYLFACLAAGGDVLLEDAPLAHMQEVLTIARRLGAELQEEKNGLYVQAPEKIRMIPYLITQEYPNFPTDLQSVILPVLSKGEGQCYIQENIFENRFLVVPFLQQMGANIFTLDNRRILLRGCGTFRGQTVIAQELRGGAALVIAGLMAEGETTVLGCHFIDRGYENISKDFMELGARIHRFETSFPVLAATK